MKKFKQNILIVLAIVLVGSFGVNAQEGKLETQVKKTKVDKVKEEKIMKEKKEEYKDQIVDELG